MATYYVSDATGDDSDTGLTEALAWATIDKAMNTVAADDTVYVKADGDYLEIATIDTVGTVSGTITFEGYTTTPGDGGQATIDGESTRSYCITHSLASTASVYYVFKSFVFKRATTANVNVPRETIFKNCQFNNSVGDGCLFDSRAFFENCLFDSNGDAGANGAVGLVAIGCRFSNNTGNGIGVSGSSWVHSCTFFGDGGGSITLLGGAGAYVTVLGCTIDGDGKTTDTAIDCNTSAWGRIVIANNIIYDCTRGIESEDQGTYFISRNNLLNNNTIDYTDFQTFEGEVTSAPQFEDEAGEDYSLGSASPAKNAGYDGYLLNGSTQRADIGAIESTAAGGGGGGLLMPNKRAGKQ